MQHVTNRDFLILLNSNTCFCSRLYNESKSIKCLYSRYLSFPIGFQIGNEDADAIFDDLDHDGDGRISFEDFSFGFRDFLTPGAKRGNAQLTTLATASPAPAAPKSRAPSFR